MATPPPSSRLRGILFLVTILAVVAIMSYFGGRRLSSEAAKPPVLSAAQEIALGHKAMPSIAESYGGISKDAAQVELVNRVGKHLAESGELKKTGWQYSFYVLGDADKLAAFAIPGGPVLITAGLLNRLKTEGELAAVLAHQMAHIVNRDIAKQLSAKNMTAGLGAAGDDEKAIATELQMLAIQVVEWKYNNASELAADKQAVQYLGDAGYNPEAMLGVLKVLSTSYYAGAPVPYFSTHINPPNRVAALQDAINAAYPDGVPEHLSN